MHRPGQERKADIIFIHGLGGTSRATWSKDRDVDNFFWPGLFLPQEPEIGQARILTFGYDGNFLPSSRKNKKVSILDFAKDLLYDLKYAKDDSGPLLEELGIGEARISPCFHRSNLKLTSARNLSSSWRILWVD